MDAIKPLFCPPKKGLFDNEKAEAAAAAWGFDSGRDSAFDSDNKGFSQTNEGGEKLQLSVVKYE